MKWMVISALLLFSLSSAAGFLRISSEPNLHLLEKKGQIFLRGKFTLQNQGDEPAKDVFPEFTIDRWFLALSKQTLDPGQKFTWDVDERIPRDRLCITISADCFLPLPPRGDFKLRIDKNYQDQNGYAFSAPDIVSLSLAQQGRSVKQPDLLKMELKVIAESDVQYRADYVIRNQVDRPLNLVLHYLVPKEMELRTASLPVEIFAQGELRGSFIFKNKSGLIGSEYLSLLAAEMMDDQQRRLVWSPAQFRIQKFLQPVVPGWSWRLSQDGVWVLVWGLLSIMAFTWVYFYWHRQAKLNF